MYQHVRSDERELIAIWVNQGISIRTIAKRVHRSHSTVMREVRRNHSLISGRYVAITAERRAEERSIRSRRHHPLKNPDIYSYILERLRRSWSPEQISGRLKKENGHSIICPETIYRFIYQENNQDKKIWEYLPRKQKRRQKQTGRSCQKARIPQRVSIHQRSEAIDNRRQFGHWEGDTIEGKKSEGDGIHTEVERQSRFLIARKVDRIASPETIRAQLRMFRSLPDTARQSTTLDNGREHHRHMALRFLGMTTYFCDPYASWQRGTNENTNGLLRRYCPKGSSLKDLTQDELNDIVWEINSRPRKCLGYNTSREAFEEQLKVVRF